MEILTTITRPCLKMQLLDTSKSEILISSSIMKFIFVFNNNLLYWNYVLILNCIYSILFIELALNSWLYKVCTDDINVQTGWDYSISSLFKNERTSIVFMKKPNQIKWMVSRFSRIGLYGNWSGVTEYYKTKISYLT